MSTVPKVVKTAAWQTGKLFNQARFTLDMVKADAPAAKLAGPKFLAECEADLKQLEQLVREAHEARFDAKSLTIAEGRAADQAVAWLRSFRRYYRAAQHTVDSLPILPRTPERIDSTGLALEVANLIQVGRENAPALAPSGITSDFLADGARIENELTAANRKQEFARREALSGKNRAVRDLKSRLYKKVIQLAAFGKDAHRGDKSRQKQYNLRILYGGAPATPPSPAPSTPSEAVAG